MNNAISITHSANATNGVAFARERAGLLPMGAPLDYLSGAEASAWIGGAGSPATAKRCAAHRSRSAIPVPLPLTG